MSQIIQSSKTTFNCLATVMFLGTPCSKLLKSLIKCNGVCVHCTISLPHVHWTIYSHKLSLKVDFLIREFSGYRAVLLEFENNFSGNKCMQSDKCPI